MTPALWLVNALRPVDEKGAVGQRLRPVDLLAASVPEPQQRLSMLI